MKIYLDLLFILNFIIDFILLLTVSIIMKRKTTIWRLLLSSLIGSLTIIVLFIKINLYQMFLIKIYISIIMILLAFNKYDFKYVINNLTCFYISSILLGGTIYALKIQGMHIILLFIISPIILYIYVKNNKMQKTKYINYYKIQLFIKKQQLNLIGYMDTGNNLTSKGTIVIISNIKNNFKVKKHYIPYQTINGVSLLECIKIDKLIIEHYGIYQNIFLGFSQNIKIDGVDVILNNKLEANIC